MEASCGECKSSSYPQQQIQIEALDIPTVVLCNSGLGGASYFGHPIPEKFSLRPSIYIDYLAYHVMRALPPLLIHHYTENAPSVPASYELTEDISLTSAKQLRMAVFWECT